MREDRSLSDSMNATVHVVVQEIVKRIPQVRSVVLIGSQARGEANHTHNEYDLIVVVPMLIVPLLLKRIRCIERELSEKYSVDLSINPLPTYRIKHPRRNVLFFEMKHGGEVLYGEDIRTEIPLGGFDEIPRETALEYLFNSYWILLGPFSVRFLAKEPERQKAKLLEYAAMKTFMRCCDILLILEGNYRFSFQERIEAIIAMYKAGPSELPGRLPDLPKFAKAAIEYRKDHEKVDDNPLEQWFLAKACLEETTNYVLERSPHAFNHDSWLGNLLNNLQFVVSQFIAERRIEMKMIGLGAPATKLQRAILLLSRALSCEKTVNIKMLEQAFKTLGEAAKINEKNGLERWEDLKNDVCGKWKYACTAMGW